MLGLAEEGLEAKVMVDLEGLVGRKNLGGLVFLLQLGASLSLKRK